VPHDRQEPFAALDIARCLRFDDREMFTFKCASCDQIHEGMPTFGFPWPFPYIEVPEAERDRRCVLTSDTCVIDDAHFFVRGCIEIPVLGTDEVFAWGVWTSLSEKNFRHFVELYDAPKRSHHGPFFGWLMSPIAIYPEPHLLKTQVHLRDDGTRPYVELEPTDHPLAVEQRSGITVERVGEIYAAMTNPKAS
jgi:hypothetical protein